MRTVDGRGRGSVAGRLVAAAAGVAGIAAASGCTAPEPQPIGSTSVTITSPPPSSPVTPAEAADPGALNVVTNTFTGLTRFRGTTGTPTNAAAQKLETADNVTWNVTLRKDMTFHDGTPVTADSFIDAWNWAAHEPNESPSRPYFAPIAGFDATAAASAPTLSGLAKIDDLTFTITLTAPNSQFPVLLAMPAYAPLPPSFFADPEGFAQAPVGNGPYQVVAASAEGSTLQAVDGHFFPRPAADVVEFVPEAGGDSITVVEPPGPARGSSSTAAATEATVVAPTATVQALTFPTYSPRFADPGIRLAFSTAIDRALIIADHFGERALPATSWVSPVANGYRPNACGSPCIYNADTAQNALANAGGFDGDLVISFVADPDTAEWVERVCRSITNTLAVPCRGQAEPDQAAFDAKVISRTFDGPFVTTAASPVPTAEAYLRPFTTGAPGNASGYSNPLFDAALASAATGPAKDAPTAFGNASKVLAKDVPTAPLWVRTTAAEYPDSIEAVSFTPLGLIDLANLKAW